MVAWKSAMLRAALSDSDTGAVRGSTIRLVPQLMSPPCALLPPLPVLMVTLLPPSSAAAMVAVFKLAASSVVLKLGPPVTLVSSTWSLMKMSFGSSNHCPARPRGASVATAGGRASSQPPEVSMKPPSPPAAPPRALRLPKARVARSLQRMMRPPSPLAVASARMRASGPKYTACELRRLASRPCRPPPTKACPPPPAPDTSTRAVPAKATFWPSRVTVPPRPTPPTPPVASTSPLSMDVPALPLSTLT